MKKITIITMILISGLGLQSTLAKTPSKPRMIVTTQSKSRNTNDAKEIVITKDEAVNSVISSVVGNISIVKSTTPKVIIRGDKKYIDALDITIKNGELIVSSKRNASSGSQNNVMNNFAIELYQPDIKNLTQTGVGNISVCGSFKNSNVNVTLTGVGSVTFNEFQCNDITVSVTGTGSVTLSGMANHATYLMSGVGSIEAMDFIVADVTAVSTGVGDIHCYASKTLTSKSNECGKIYYKGNPQVISDTKPRTVNKEKKKRQATPDSGKPAKKKRVIIV